MTHGYIGVLLYDGTTRNNKSSARKRLHNCWCPLRLTAPRTE
jgi:hypothetical protein